VPKGATPRSLATQLEREHLLDSHLLWRFFLWRHGRLKVEAGRFSLHPGMSVVQLGQVLSGPPLPEDTPFVVVEGSRIRDVDAALAQAGFIQAGAYKEATASSEGYTAPFALPKGSLEGYLYPETYRIPKEHFDVRKLVQRQLDVFDERIWRPFGEPLKRSSRSLHEVVTMASMLEREEPSPRERPLVAGILWKRIDRHIPLGVDATSRYELTDWNDRHGFLQHLRDDQDPYNSRTRAGLPPTPIGAPSVESFQAALEPKRSEFLYYHHDGERKLHASRNAQEHEALRKRFGIY
jgi:UPF0755 protein